MSSRLTISRTALSQNYAAFQKAANTTIAAVVKGNAYGVGVVEVVSTLIAQGCVHFFVATTAEGVAIRRTLHGFTTIEPINLYILEGALPGELDTLVKYQLTPVLNTVKQIQDWQTLEQSCVVHVDTGMTRLGLDVDEAVAVIPGISCPVDYVMTHFAQADEPHNPRSQQQVHIFQNLLEMLKQNGFETKVSLSNSAGLLQGGASHYGLEEQLGRAGVGLYGANPFAEQANPMLPVASLSAQILQLRTVQKGTAIGYGGAYRTTKEMDIATVGVGYADGLPRLLSSHGVVWAAQQKCAIVGRVSMDTITVDVTDVDVHEGDWVEVFGANISVDDVAAQAQTIGYEILTGISERVPRHYIDQLL